MNTDSSKHGYLRPSTALALAGLAGALLLVAASTLAGLLISSRWGTSPVVLLYLPPVLVAAIHAGLQAGLVTAVASALAYNYYFTAPVRTFVIHSPADIVTVVILFLAAAVTSQLAASVRRQARLAATHATRNATIAGFARRLLAAQDEASVARETVVELSTLFGCQAVLMSGSPAQSLASQPDHLALNPSDMAAAALTLQSGTVTGRGQRLVRESDWQFHAVASQDNVLAAIGLARDDGAQPVAREHMQLLGNLLDQAALAFERARLECEARATVALRERDRLRSALLMSIGDDVKPRLVAIQASVRALRRDGVTDRSLVANLAAEVAKVDRYIDNLVDLGPGTDQAPLNFGAITIDLHRRLVLREGREVHLTPKEFAVLAELAKHAGTVLSHRHLLSAIWGSAQQDHIDYLRVAVRALRQKLERDPASPELIRNEPGVGYRLTLQQT